MENWRQQATIPEPHPTEADVAAHVSTYRSFVKYSALFVAHVVVILALMAYFLV